MAIDVLFSTVDPTVELAPGKPVPAMTTMLYRVCDNDPVKFEEATRLVQLIVAEAINRSRLVNMNLYQDLIDAGVEEHEIERKIGEGRTLEDIYVQAADDGLIDVETGCCMCGSPVDQHGMGDGHSPVDSGSYFLDQLRKKAA